MAAQSRRHLCLLTLVWDVYLNSIARRTGQRKFMTSGASLPGDYAGKSLTKSLVCVADGNGICVLPCVSGWEGNRTSNHSGVHKVLDACPLVIFPNPTELANVETLQVKREKETLRFYD